MIPRLLISLLIAFAAGFCAISLVWPRSFHGRATAVLRCCLAFGFGSGISSCLFFLWLCLAAKHGGFFPTFIVPELVITVSLGLTYLFLRRGLHLLKVNQRREPANKGLVDWLLPAIFFGVVLCAVISFAVISHRNPSGDFDAVSIWNLRARFLARGTNHWEDAFADSPSLPHPDYPLLLPATVARSWKYMGTEPAIAPIAVAFLFTFSSVGLLCSSLFFLRKARVAYLGGIVLLGATPFVALGASQYADVAMGFFMMSAIIILALYDASPRDENTGFLLLSGLAAGFCAWTKNEGLLFVSLLLTVRFAFSIRNDGWGTCRREIAMLLLGCMPMLACVTYFKREVAPAVYYLKAGNYSGPSPMKYFLDTATTRQKLADGSRYWMIAKAMASDIVDLGGGRVGIAALLLLFVLSAKLKRKGAVEVQTGIAVVALMVAGYFVVYLTTPLNLAFHLRTSLSRLVLQLWPSVVFVCFMTVSTTAS